jgi:hypothetical protein
VLGLLLVKSLPIGDPSRYEPRELIRRHDADRVEVEIAAVPARSFGMKDVRTLHAELPVKNIGNLRFVKVG